MKSKVAKVVFVWCALMASAAFGGQGEPNCKLSLHVLTDSGKKSLDITEVYSYDREDCKMQAYEKRTREMERDDVVKVKVFFAYDGRRTAN